MTKPFIFFHTKIAVNDDAKPLSILTGQDVALRNLDVQVQTHPVDFGDRINQNLELSVGDIYSNPVNMNTALRDIWVANHTGGNTGYVVITGFL